MVDGEGPMPHDAWFRLLTDQPPLYAHTLPYKVRTLPHTAALTTQTDAWADSHIKGLRSHLGARSAALP